MFKKKAAPDKPELPTMLYVWYSTRSAFGQTPPYLVCSDQLPTNEKEVGCYHLSVVGKTRLIFTGDCADKK